MSDGSGDAFPPGCAVVVGGSGGIGRAVCGRLAEHGTDVALTYRSDAGAADESAGLVEAAGRRSLAVQLDAGDGDAVGRCFDEIADRLGRIHTVVYAVGASIDLVYITDVTEDAWREVVDGDLNGFFHVVQASLPQLRQGGGSIVAVSTAGLVRHPPQDILSTVPKAGIEALVRGIAREEGRHGVRANSVAFGIVDTGHFRRMQETLDPSLVEAMKRNTALRRFGTEREAADAIVFLASAASGFTTGQRLVVDGGFSV
jgi:3-oxoacyl-[acyl-carrier protein] reductase